MERTPETATALADRAGWQIGGYGQRQSRNRPRVVFEVDGDAAPAELDRTETGA